MFGLSHDQIVASLIILAYIAGMATTLALIATYISRSETKNAKHRVMSQMDPSVDLEYIDEALAIANS